ncbi:isochorismatase family protein [Halorarius halobius]|uniref:isochorismatase family protein n=1 Tax=Halorarius halobius TaxID=2962671 RepID=UPI0020CC1031|nr:isochorismatase family protein [Halorarius halobius]
MSEQATGEESTEQVYDRAGIGHRFGYGERPVLVVVDLQYGMTDPDNPLGSDLGGAVERTNDLVAAAHEGGVPVVFTRVVTKHPDAADLGVWTEKVPNLATLKPDTRWVEIDDRIDVGDDDHILDKRQASGFHETELESMLTATSRDTVVIAGCTTSGCVRATAIDACSAGYKTVVVEECVGDRTDRVHEANLFDMDSKYADVVPLEDATAYLESGGDPQ